MGMNRIQLGSGRAGNQIRSLSAAVTNEITETPDRKQTWGDDSGAAVLRVQRVCFFAKEGRDGG